MRLKHRTVLLPSGVVFVAVMVVVAISFLMSRNTVNQEVDDTVTLYSQSTEDTITDRLNIFEETLRAGIGLLAGNNDVTPQQWEQFIGTSAVLVRYPGAQSLGYARVVPKDSLGPVTAQLQQKIAPDFSIFPAGERETYTPVLLLAPVSASNVQVIGFDVFSEPIRQKAIITARDSGKVALSDNIQSIIDKSDEGRSFVMYAPQYIPGMPTSTVDQRRRAVEGYVYVGFRINKFMSTVMSRQVNPAVAFSVSIGDSNTPLYKSSNYDELSRNSHAQRGTQRDVGGTTMHFEYIYDRSEILPSFTASRPWAILIFGTLTALLISGAVLLLLRGRANQLLLDKERSINDAKDDLLSLASHQLRTPATGVKQYLGLLLQGFSGKLTAQQYDLLEKAYAGNERQLKTINDVLYLAKLGSGRIVLSKSTFSPNKTVEDIVSELHDDIQAKQHKVSVQLPKRDKEFYGDEHMIRMAIENLLTNAIKYTHSKGKITVKLSYGREDLKVSVKDNGVGIPADQQERMFKQFERIDNDLSIAVGGSGIGLYVVQNIANLHGGYIEAVSQLGHGSEFTLILPYGAEVQNDKL